MGDSDAAIGLTILLAKWAAYVCAATTAILRFLIPTPEQFCVIFTLPSAPRYYIIIYNILRWLSGNRSWKEERKESDGTKPPNN